ncbi:MAG: 3-methyl-2-oxobutanoate dehydrogenase subunit beta, partial [Eubacteriales bacterium]|nr:3-methyl-2-oxobutanoate dehydrogenase subunit beta [Eubacteriales bacterium]
NKGKDRQIINSLLIEPDVLERHNHLLFDTYKEIADNETMCEEYLCSDAEIVLTAYGTVARIAKSAVDILRSRGIKVGLLRPITLYPFPEKAFIKVAEQDCVKEFVCIELSMGQMIEDVKISTQMKKPVKFYGRVGGNVMTPEDIVKFVTEEDK